MVLDARRLTFLDPQESHIISYYHLLLTSGLPFLKDVRIEELDYASSLTIGKRCLALISSRDTS